MLLGSKLVWFLVRNLARNQSGFFGTLGTTSHRKPDNLTRGQETSRQSLRAQFLTRNFAANLAINLTGLP